MGEGQDKLAQGTTPEMWPSVLITRRSQVQILPPLPTCQRYNRRSTTRKPSLRVVFLSGGGVRSDQIRDQESSQVSRRVSGRLTRIETNEPDWDGIGAARRRPPGRNPGDPTRSASRDRHRSRFEMHREDGGMAFGGLTSGIVPQPKDPATVDEN